MGSPFPGMDPYLEQPDVWHDFHQSFITAARDALVAQLRPNYLVKVEEHLYVHEMSADERLYLGRGDLSVSAVSAEMPARQGAALIQAPATGTIPAAVDVERLGFIEIRDRKGRELIAVIELLSPSNKVPGPDREQYLAKRRQLIKSPAHMVEIDLLRGGQRMPVQGLPECDYCAIVSRANERPSVGIWPLRLRDRLPVIPIPLRDPDPDARLDLQQVLDQIHDAAGYADYIYESTPHPPLHPADDAWARELIGPRE